MTGMIQAASIGIPDTLFIMVLALVVFGPRRLPAIGRQIGKLMYEFRKASNDFKYQMEEEMRTAEEADRRKKLDDENRRLYPALEASLPSVAGQSVDGDAATVMMPLVPQPADPYAALNTTQDPYAALETSAMGTSAQATSGFETTSDPAQDTAWAKATDGLEVQGAVLEASAPSSDTPIALYPRIVAPTIGEVVAAERPGTIAASAAKLPPAATLTSDAATQTPEADLAISPSHESATLKSGPHAPSAPSPLSPTKIGETDNGEPVYERSVHHG